MSSPMPSSSNQAACSSSRSFSYYAENLADQNLVAAAASLYAGYCAQLLICQVLRSAENTARTILIKLGRPIQNEENIAVPSPQAAAVFSNPNYRASPVQISEQNNARGNRYSDVNSPALKLLLSEKRGDLIAKGSFASVYRGDSNEDGIFFAAKGVSLAEPNHLPHLENEIAILKLLDDHENIIQYYGTEKDGEMLYIFLELASHGTLEQAYKKRRFTESQVSDYTRQILQGLTYLHSCKVVHGDLKCANILLTESGRIKIADFGLSKRREDHSQVADPKRGGYGFPSDIGSLGCTVLEMSTRKYPQCNAKKVLISEELAIRSGRGIIVPRNLPRNLRDFINQCLQPDPNQRPTAAELLAHPFAVSLSEHKKLCHLEDEIDILEGLDHENIIQCYGTQKDGEMLYIFLELVSQGTLEQAYKNCPFKQSQVSDYTRQILQGLTYLHSCKVFHGDVNCANIFVTESGRIKLADFGVSKRMEDHSYFPSDIRDLGYTVLEMSTGEYPRLHISAKRS
ncbi:hypothetical protein OIU74_015613 [Salix koriyanagi]|uniref:Protein kinase domain-containing protein n=1 Tax=Salix koriyanagi TaxID=2511006 RepID=A0A9Q0PMV5_9ROSI|nr:hypothetical protein OIU74_015613 [Salix koriyanagi]